MSPRKIIILFVLLEISIILISLLIDGNSLTALQTITRFSGRLSLFLFSAIFLLYDKPQTIHPWLSEKFYLLFAIVHGIHLLELLSLVYLSNASLMPIRIAGGFLAYLYIFLMPVFVKLQESQRISSKTFSVLEIVFIYYVWLVFFLTYLPRVLGALPEVGGSYSEHVALLGLISVLLGTRLVGLIQFSKNKTD
jgi:hypothetical protein